ncbi:MAG: hypothetical protein Q8O40_01675 [Chloroflexota bacterium]|nr:hypothetical protein [Chloroflexota bacterium]
MEKGVVDGQVEVGPGAGGVGSNGQGSGAALTAAATAPETRAAVAGSDGVGPDGQVDGAPPTKAPAAPEAQRSKAEAPATPETQESKADQIRRLLDEGYSFHQIELEFGFHEATIRKVQRERVKPAAESAAVVKATAQDTGPPVMKLGRYEIIPPEQALRGIRLQDGDYKVGFIDGIGMLLLAVRYTQELATLQANMMDPTIKMVQAMREEERIAIEKTDRSAASAASRAAEEMADRVVSHFEDRLARIEAKATPGPSSGNPMMAMMARVMEPLINNAMGGLVPGLTPKGQDGQPQVPGFTYKTVQEANNAT